MKHDDYYVVIPAYNESATIRDIAQSVLKYTDNIIIVDDASKDDTSVQLTDLPVTVLNNKINQGKAASLMRGFNVVLNHRAKAVITLDGDAQHDPDDIPKLIIAFENYPDRLIIGARLQNTERAPKNRLFANRFADFWVSWAASHKVTDSQSGFRLYPIELLKQTKATTNRYSSFVFESEIIINAARKGFKTFSVSIKSCYPEQRRASHYRPWIDITKTVLMIAGKIISRGFNIPGLIRSLR